MRIFLRSYREAIPKWLETFRRDEVLKFPLADFFSSQILFYPGPGRDGHPIAIFNSAHAAHCFVYADYGYDRNELTSDLVDQPFRGYHTLGRIHLSESDLTPHGWTRHVSVDEVPASRGPPRSPFGIIEILERDAEFDDDHGASRLAVLFLFADGFATFDALFCQSNGIRPPFCTVVQDHGFGGNYDRFGRGGLLEKLALRCGVFPQFLIVARNSVAWDGYNRCKGALCEPGGQHRHNRCLYQRSSTP